MEGREVMGRKEGKGREGGKGRERRKGGREGKERKENRIISILVLLLTKKHKSSTEPNLCAHFTKWRSAALVCMKNSRRGGLGGDITVSSLSLKGLFQALNAISFQGLA